MKFAFQLIFFLCFGIISAQKDCDFTANVTDSLGTYKSTNDYMVYEKNFAGNKNYIFLSLISTNDTPTLQVQIIQKSKEFIKANCFDKNSKLFLQLDNGRVISLIHIDQENCGTLIRDNEGFDNRLLTGSFMFLKGSLEELKKSPANLMRIKYLTDMQDYVLPKIVKSEMNGKTYEPETYFINYLKCIEPTTPILTTTQTKNNNTKK